MEVLYIVAFFVLNILISKLFPKLRPSREKLEKMKKYDEIEGIDFDSYNQQISGTGSGSL